MSDGRLARKVVAALACLAVASAFVPLRALAIDEPADVAAETVVEDQAATVEVVDVDVPAADEDPVAQGDEAQAAPEDEAAEETTADETVVATQEEVAEEEDKELVAQASTAAADQLAAQHAGTLEDGRYDIVSALGSTYSLDVKLGSKANGASIILFGSKVSDNQRWEIANVGGGYITIKSVSSGKYLQAGYNGNAMSVVQNARSESERGQLWIAVRLSDGSCRFVSALDTTKVLDVRGGKAKNACEIIVFAQKAGNAANQCWNLRVTNDILDAEAAAHKGDLADGTYLITSAGDGTLALSLSSASQSAGTTTVLAKNSSKEEQKWNVRHVAPGYVVISSAYSGKVLDVKGGKPGDGIPIIQWTSNGDSSRNQLWIAAKGSDGSIKLTSALASSYSRALATNGSSASEGASIVLAPRSASSDATQRWTFAKTEAATTQPTSESPSKGSYVADGVYQITTMLDSGKALDVAYGSKKEGTGVKLWTKGAQANQYWTLSHDSEGYVHLTCINSGLELSYATGSLKQSATPYRWAFDKVSSGVYKIRDVASGKYLDVARSVTDNNTNKVIVFASNSGKNQQWKLGAPTVSGNMPIMGSPQVTQAQAVRYLNAHFASTGQKLPTKWTKDGETVAKLVKYFWEEGAAEGVRGDIALAQSIHETDWFQFTGIARPAQYNFAGLGTTDAQHPGNSFPNARTGVRAQIQHLKAYASKEPLKQARVDIRFDLVERGCAPTIAGLTGKWAVPGWSYVGTGDNKVKVKVYYHDYLIRYLKGMLAS